jgi:integrase
MSIPVSLEGIYCHKLPQKMRGQFNITSCVHGRNRYLVTGYINEERKRAFFRTKAEAEAYAAKRNLELRNFGHKLSVMPHALRSEAMYWSERLRPFGMTIARVALLWLDQHDWRSKSVLVWDALVEYFAELDRQLAAGEIRKRHHEDLKGTTKKLLADFAKFHVCDLRADVLNKWLISQPVSATTRNNIRLRLSKFFKYARKKLWIEENPIGEVDKAKIQRTKEPCIYTPEQARSILLHADHDLVPFFAIGLFAGLRTSEIERLNWNNVDFRKRHIKIAAANTKTAQKRFVPMSDNLVAWLVPYAQAQGQVAPHCDEPRRKAVRDRAGIPAKGMANAARHSYCSYNFAVNKELGECAKAAGNSPTVFLANYNHLVEESEGERYFAIRPQDTQNILKVA